MMFDAEDGNSGLSVTAFTSNETDARAALPKLNHIEVSALSFRLHLINLRCTSGMGLRSALEAVKTRTLLHLGD